MYRAAVYAVLAAQDDYNQGAVSIATSATAALINLIIIMLLNKVWLLSTFVHGHYFSDFLSCNNNNNNLFTQTMSIIIVCPANSHKLIEAGQNQHYKTHKRNDKQLKVQTLMTMN